MYQKCHDCRQRKRIFKDIDGYIHLCRECYDERKIKNQCTHSRTEQVSRGKEICKSCGKMLRIHGYRKKVRHNIVKKVYDDTAEKLTSFL